MKFKFACLSVFVTSFIATPSLSSVLQGEMDGGYDLPYLWDSYAGYSNTDWMAAIGNEKRLSEISMPGTHNSLSLYGGDVPATQTLSIAEQLDMGIRYIDARFKYRDSDLIAYHGIISQYQTFDDFISIVSQFLNANPTETIIIRVQNEGGAKEYQHDFYQKFKEILAKYKQNNAIPYSNNPTLGDIRGKFVFIRDFNIFGGRIGIERASLHIQDNYKLVTNWDLYSKWERVKSHFYSINSKQVSLNYLSGSVGSFPYFVASGKSSPSSHAPQLWTGVSTVDANQYRDFPRTACIEQLCSVNFAGINQLTEKWIKENKFLSNLGIVAMDFPGGGIVDTIIQYNSSNKHSLVVYEDVNQNGDSLVINSDIPFLGNMNDQMSSWVIPYNWEVRFYEHENYQGRYYTRKTGKGNTDEFNDIISSIKILKK
ncbi:1-phosphatidylinositol phosphodiesterase [Moritella viscosa]|uniref:phosphatidylinositol-specific phospholipase C domain-containing protein n=1 Tax=Moritella viscosa TaxID=80854 RepID=UPI0009138132|nr:phosphatidylinositol-specific phospholipase C domain-containing protein [Moritella viscosa]SGY81372.1 1-phosphatidylinositol phosphodiesterase [Moritella viscosa]